MADDDIRLLLEALGGQLMEHQANPAGTVAILITETLRFRDKLLEETGVTLTVQDTRAALDALELQLTGRPWPKSLTSEQKALAQLYVDRLTLFKNE